MTRVLSILAPSVAVLGFLSACTVGPQYDGPPASIAALAPKQFQQAVIAGLPTTPRPSPWWAAYGDAQLNLLMQRALADNLDLAIAQSRLKQARAGLLVQRRNLLPDGSAKAAYDHQQIALAAFGIDPSSLGLAPKPIDTYDLEFDASWELDLFGGGRRSVEAAKADAEGASDRIEDVRVALLAEVASTYVDLRGAQQRSALLRAEVKAAQDIVNLTSFRQTHGTASEFDVGRSKLQLQTTQSALDPVLGQIDGDLIALAILTGHAPGDIDADLTQPSAIPVVPDQLMVGDPALLLRRRPDVRVAERGLAADTARIGVAMADLFPKVRLAGSYGDDATKVSQIGTNTALDFSVGPTLSWDFLDFGRVKARIAQSKAKASESLANYHKAVLTALQDAETNLSRINHDRAYLEGVREAARIASRNSDLARMQYKAGTASQLDLLDAEHQRLQAEDTVILAQVSFAKDYASLSKALGYGWDAASATVR